MYIKGQFTTLNKYINAERTNKHMAAKIKREEMFAAKVQMLGKKFKTPCRLKFIWHIKNKRTDPDNVAWSKKVICDSLVQASVIPDDTMKHIIGFIDEFVIDKNVGVEIIPIYEECENEL